MVTKDSQKQLGSAHESSWKGWVIRVPHALHRYYNLGTPGSRKAGRRVATSQPGHYSYPTGGGLVNLKEILDFYRSLEITELISLRSWNHPFAHGSSKAMDLGNSFFACQLLNSSVFIARKLMQPTLRSKLIFSNDWITVFCWQYWCKECPRLGCLVTSRIKYKKKSNTYDIYIKRRLWRQQSQIPLLWSHLTDSIQFLF